MLASLRPVTYQTDMEWKVDSVMKVLDVTPSILCYITVHTYGQIVSKRQALFNWQKLFKIACPHRSMFRHHGRVYLKQNIIELK